MPLLSALLVGKIAGWFNRKSSFIQRIRTLGNMADSLEEQ
ncbi:hypothetical protein HMPREF3187_00136 [Aerococcus christensenii]|uniref:Uncharacterized protein n=1 Tax=Aerococcus christensenii TaxID=87541 RepID=A0A133Y4F0_9LACT|nr:hypothetical protein HMPREF3187_00136 [Aerococcus christensenii]